MRKTGPATEPLPSRKERPPSSDRRRVLKGVAASVGVAATGVGLSLALRTRDPRRVVQAPGIMRDHRVNPAQLKARMVIARGLDPAHNVRAAIEAMGGMQRFVQRGERVVIKPNVGWNRTPAQAANTDPQVVAELVRLVRDAGAAQIWVTDVSVNNAERSFKRSGIGEAARAAGAEVVIPNASLFREIAVGGVLLRSAQVLRPFIEADRIINAAVVKQHSLSGATLAMKNWYGVLGGHRARLHQDIHTSIAELAQMMRPTLSVLDATRVLTGNGPSGGSLDDVKTLNTVIASVDEVALDAFGGSLLGLRPEALPFLAQAEQRKLGTSRWRDLVPVEVQTSG